MLWLIFLTWKLKIFTTGLYNKASVINFLVFHVFFKPNKVHLKQQNMAYWSIFSHTF